MADNAPQETSPAAASAPVPDAATSTTATESTASGLPPITKGTVPVPGAGDTPTATDGVGAASLVPDMPATNGGDVAADKQKDEGESKVVEAPMAAVDEDQGDSAKPVTEDTATNGSLASEKKEPVTGGDEAPSDDKEPPKPVTVEEVRDETLPAPKEPEPASISTNGNGTASPAEKEPQTGEKRKQDESTATSTAATAASEETKPEGDEATASATAATEDTQTPAEKKLKTNGEPAKKPGRPRKDTAGASKKPPAPVGRTARKTRSQGNAE